MSEWCDGNPLAHERVKAAVDPRLSWHASSSAGLSVFVFVSVDVAPLVLLLFLSAGGDMWLLLPSLWGPMSMSIWPSSE